MYIQKNYLCITVYKMQQHLSVQASQGWALLKAAVIITVMTVLIGVVSLAFCVYEHFFAHE